MKTALLIGRKNGAGLDQDAALIAEVLRNAGWRILHFAPHDWRGLLPSYDKADVVIHLERFFPLWRWRGMRHILIPNQERFPLRHLGRLRRVDHILCKSRHAVEIFSKHHASVHFVGFTSVDRMLPQTAAPDYGCFFHLAGRSTLKGTDTILEAWCAHPEWPELMLVQHPDNAPAAVPANVTLLSRVVSNEELRVLQNRCGVHLCPSLSEGWGHYIVEAMSCRALVLTTHAPPMNELVQPDRGLLLPYEKSTPRHLGTNFYVSRRGVEEVVQRVLTLPASEKLKLGVSARAWFEENDRMFRVGFGEALGRLVTEDQ
jgi:glycosyltransferase involved in cell wall biosynthesis